MRVPGWAGGPAPGTTAGAGQVGHAAAVPVRPRCGPAADATSPGDRVTGARGRPGCRGARRRSAVVQPASLNVARTFLAWSIRTVQVVAVPEQAPPQPVKVEPVAGRARSFTVEPRA